MADKTIIETRISEVTRRMMVLFEDLIKEGFNRADFILAASVCAATFARTCCVDKKLLLDIMGDYIDQIAAMRSSGSN